MKRESKGQGVRGLVGERENSEGAVGARVRFRVELEVGVNRTQRSPQCSESICF